MSSEFSLIEKYFCDPRLSFPVPELGLGIGDDCSLISVPAGFQLAQSMDTLVADVHFPKDADPYLIACRALAVNLSDLSAMAARPLSFSLALSLPEQMSASGDDLALESWLARFSKGLSEYAERYHCPLIGGDTTRGPLTITVQVQGLVKRELRRSTAQVGDDIYVTGTLGDAALALPILEVDSPLSALTREDIAGLQAPENKQHFLNAYFQPKPPVAFAQAAAELLHAAIDISDGLLADLGHICKASGVSAELQSETLPISAESNTCISKELALEAALTGGDDYQLCFTAAPEHREGISKIAKTQNVAISRIGKLQPERKEQPVRENQPESNDQPERKEQPQDTHRVTVIDGDGKVLKFSATGYDHFL